MHVVYVRLQDLHQAQSQLASLQQSIQHSLPQKQELEAAIHSLEQQHLEAVAAKQELAAQLVASKQDLQVSPT
jgi:septal ring factor EnvC (AmiA/AmiB activator)